MSKVTALIACLFSVSAWACPDLTGTYKLEFENYLEVISVSQATENNVTTYTITTDGGMVMSFVADGEKRTTTRTQGDLTNISEDVVTCEGEVVVNNYQERIVNAAGEVTYAEFGRQSMSLNEAGNIIEAGSYTDNKGETGSGTWEWIRQ